MARANVKLLTNEELKFFNDVYIFDYDDEYIIVSNKYYNRSTRHSRDATFFINSKVRKLTFTVEAINIWIELDKEFPKEFSLVDIQQAVNTLFVLYKPISKKDVLKMLKSWRK